MAISGDARKRGAWETRFARYRASGLSVARFCQQEGVSTNAFYYWAKRLKAASGPRAPWAPAPSRRACSPAMSTADRNAHGAAVRFRWNNGTEVLVPAECLEVIRCLAECLAEAGGHRGGAFQEVVVKA
jgi:hypothetical protein